MANEQNNPHMVFMLGEIPAAGAARLAVIVTGQWEKVTDEGSKILKVTLAHLKSIIANFAAKLNGEINVDYDHKSEPQKRDKIPGAIPSAGRITALSEPEPYTDPAGVERYILWGTYQPTDAAR